LSALKSIYGWTLVNSFNKMSASLRLQTDQLEDRVNERTNELEKVNEQLRKEIEERKQGEEALRKSEEQLSNAMEIANLGHWEYDVANDLFTFNDHFYRIFRTTAEQVGGYTISSAEYDRRFVHPDDMSVVEEENRKAIEATDPHFNRQLEHRILYGDGTVGYIVVRFFIVKDSQNRTVRTYGVNQDITERKRLEEEREKLESRLQQAQKTESISTLAGGIAHQFNNALSPISVSLDMLDMDYPGNEKIANYTKQMKDSAHRMAQLTSRLLAYARGGKYQAKTISINDFVENTLPIIHHVIKPDIEIITDLIPYTLNIKGRSDTDADGTVCYSGQCIRGHRRQRFH